jgi:hypothetical protein
MKHIFLTALGLLIYSTASAQFARVEGVYASSTVSAHILLLDRIKGVVAASSEVIGGTCSGSVAGIGQVKGRVLTYSPYVKEPSGEQCVMTLIFDATWKQVKIAGENCSYYSGAGCGWENQVATKRNAN